MSLPRWREPFSTVQTAFVKDGLWPVVRIRGQRRDDGSWREVVVKRQTFHDQAEALLQQHYGVDRILDAAGWQIQLSGLRAAVAFLMD